MKLSIHVIASSLLRWISFGFVIVPTCRDSVFAKWHASTSRKPDVAHNVVYVICKLFYRPKIWIKKKNFKQIRLYLWRCWRFPKIVQTSSEGRGREIITVKQRPDRQTDRVNRRRILMRDSDLACFTVRYNGPNVPSFSRPDHFSNHPFRSFPFSRVHLYDTPMWRATEKESEN